MVDQYTASGLFGLTDGSGFSATVFEKLDTNGIGTGQYSFAARGTQAGLWPPTTADLSADILADGIALDQVVDMYHALIVCRLAALKNHPAHVADVQGEQVGAPGVGGEHGKARSTGR